MSILALAAAAVVTGARSYVVRRIHIDAVNSYAARLASQQATMNKAA